MERTLRQFYFPTARWQVLLEVLGQKEEKSDLIYQVPLLSTVASQIQFPSVTFCIFHPLTDLQRFKYNTKLQTLSKEAREKRAGEACLFSLGLWKMPL